MTKISYTEDLTVPRRQRPGGSAYGARCLFRARRGLAWWGRVRTGLRCGRCAGHRRDLPRSLVAGDVELTPLERELLRSWWVRRLAFVAHAGAAAITTVQTYSRLEHSLGVLVLVAHFAPGDACTRAAALLHDIGHLPMSHTCEGVAGLDHHELGSARIAELSPLLDRHGIETADVLATVEGRRASVLGGATPGVLKLDHLDSFVRSGRAHGADPTTADDDTAAYTGD